MDDLISEFIAETQEMVAALGSEIVAWEADPADTVRLNAIFRFAHTVKGNCGFFDFPRLETLSHAAEDVLSDLREGRREADRATVSAVLAVIDRMAEITQDIADTGACPPGDDSRLIAALRGEVDAGEDDCGNHAARGEIAPAITSRSVRLPVELLDRVMSGVSDIVLARNELTRIFNELGEDHALRAPFDRLSTLITEVRDSMTRTRMQPIETLFAQLPRMVRDLSSQLGKQVLIETDGGAVELDREMIEVIRDPILHQIRNGIDHGIELPEERRATGKNEIGIIKVCARQSGNKVIIEISDDGRGIDCDKLTRKAVETGLLTQAEADALSPADQVMLICEPGLSTANRVSEISGRGVGMDVVRANIEQIGGKLALDSVKGKGLRVLLELPLTLSITPAITVMVGSHRMAIPHSFCEEIIDTRGGAVAFDRMGDRWLAAIRGQRLPCTSLPDLLDVEESAGARRTLLVLRLAGGTRFAITVDQVLAHEEMVIKPVAPALLATGLYAGTTLSDEGLPTLLLDVNGIATAAGVEFGMENRIRQRDDEAKEHDVEKQREPIIVFTSLDDRRRAIRMAVVERIDTVDASQLVQSGGSWRVVLGDAILPVVGIPEAGPRPGKVRLLRLDDGGSVLAFACCLDSDIANLPDALKPAPRDAEVEGVALIDGLPVELLDTHCLFARYGEAPTHVELPVCALSANDRWAQHFLKPVIEAAGYRVVDGTDGVPADLAISLGGQNDAHGNATQRIILREEEDPDGTGDASIYRYDREALLAALQSARKGRAA